MIAGVAVAAIAIGYLASRKHLSAAGSRRLHVSEGTVEVVSEREGDCRVRIGGTALRLSGPDALEAFSPGEAYRVYYLAGPVALVLSGEALSGPASEEGREAAARTDAAERETAAAQISVVRQGYVIVVLIGVLALAIPFAGSTSAICRRASGPWRGSPSSRSPSGSAGSRSLGSPARGAAGPDRSSPAGP